MYQHGYSPPPRTSGLAIAGFACSFFCGLLGLVLSILGLNECNKSNGMVTGRGLAIAGIVLSGLHFVGAILLWVFIIFAAREGVEQVEREQAAFPAKMKVDRAGTDLERYYAEHGELPKGHVEMSRCQPGSVGYAWDGDGQTVDARAVGFRACDGSDPVYSLHASVKNGAIDKTIRREHDAP